MMTYLKMLLSDWSTVKSALSVGFQHLSWATTDTGAPIAPAASQQYEHPDRGEISALCGGSQRSLGGAG